MDKKLEAIRGGGGSIKVGAVGTISSLMTRELQSSTPSSCRVPESHVDTLVKLSESDEQASSSALRASIKHQIPSSTTPKRQKPKVASEYKGINNTNSSSPSNKNNSKRLDFASKTRSHKRSPHVYMLNSENAHLEKTPLREKPMRKGSNMVEIVDINCGNSAASLSTRLKKLGISRMSQSFM